MDRAAFIKHKEIISKWANGEIVQYKHEGEWYTPDSQESLSFNDWMEYRIKPSPEYVPFDFSDAEKLMGKSIKHKRNGIIYLICSLTPVVIYLPSYGYIEYDVLLDSFESLDGSPCGKLKE